MILFIVDGDSALRVYENQGKEEWNGGGREAQEGEDICALIANSCCCTAETNKILQSNFTPIYLNQSCRKLYDVIKIS